MESWVTAMPEASRWAGSGSKTQDCWASCRVTHRGQSVDAHETEPAGVLGAELR